MSYLYVLKRADLRTELGTAESLVCEDNQQWNARTPPPPVGAGQINQLRKPYNLRYLQMLIISL